MLVTCAIKEYCKSTYKVSVYFICQFYLRNFGCSTLFFVETDKLHKNTILWNRNKVDNETQSAQQTSTTSFLLLLFIASSHDVIRSSLSSSRLPPNSQWITSLRYLSELASAANLFDDSPWTSVSSDLGAVESPLHLSADVESSGFEFRRDTVR